MNDTNHVELGGNVQSEAYHFSLGSGQRGVSLTIRNVPNEGKEANFFNVVSYIPRQIEALSKLTVGTAVLVKGQLRIKQKGGRTKVDVHPTSVLVK